MSDIFDGLTTSKKIRGLLASRGETQRDLAKLLHRSPMTISAWMAKDKWTVKELKAIAEHFGVEASDLI